MKYRVFLVICLSAMLALPVVAQQASDNSGQSSSQAITATEREPLRVPKGPDFWDGDDPNVFNLVMHPWANKKYVHRLTDPIRDRLNELDEITAETKSRARDIDARDQQQLQLASDKLSLADQHATDAVNKAQAAQTAASQATTRVSSEQQKIDGRDQFKGATQTEIRFRPGQTVLSKAAKDALDQMAGPLKSERSYIVEVRGFAPGSGTAAIASSQKMADSVVRYLVETHGIPVYRIYVLGMGNAVVAGDGSATQRVRSPRVEVNVLKNDLVNTAQR